MSRNQVLSLGAGVQSSTLLLMVKEGELEAECAIFADTQWEPTPVYDYLNWLEQESTIPVHRVTAGDIRSDALSSKRFASMPLNVRNPKGDSAKLRRQCTKEYKIYPIRHKLRELYGPKAQVDLMLGISLDETQRMKPSDVKWATNNYPLVDKRMRRSDCVKWLETHNYPTPPKSACIGCPYHDDGTWRRMQGTEEWADVVDFDSRIRTLPRIDGEVFIHRSLKPLAEVDLSTLEDHGQGDLFAEECEGMCGN